MTIGASATRAAAILAIASASIAGLLAQTPVKLPKNRYTPQQDVELGREAAAEVRRKYPVIQDARISAYLTARGDRLVAAAPPALKESVYEILVHGGEPEGDQRLRAARRSCSSSAECSARWSAVPPAPRFHKAPSSGSARCCCGTAAISRNRRTSSAPRSWPAPATIRARSRACSRRSNASRRAAAEAVHSG